MDREFYRFLLHSSKEGSGIIPTFSSSREEGTAHRLQVAAGFVVFYGKVLLSACGSLHIMIKIKLPIVMNGDDIELVLGWLENKPRDLQGSFTCKLTTNWYFV